MDTTETPVPTPSAPKLRKAIVKPVRVAPKHTEDDERAEVQLGVRVFLKVQRHLEEVKAATGWTRRELVERAILSL
jgi:hypothetical protein